jgi:hypothetical protein
MQALIEKLMQAGWIEGSATVDRDDKNYVLNIIWSETGKKNLAHFFFMTAQIEARTQSKLSGEELASLKGLAEIAQLRNEG